jgi:hypothetical protein
MLISDISVIVNGGTGKISGKESDGLSTHSNLIQSLTGDNGELVLQFFVTFSRFEYALKRAGFVKNGAYGNASPDWQRFANEKGNALLDDPTDIEFTEACSFLLREPPRKQIVVASHRSLQWQKNTKRSGEGNVEYLLRLVKDVRNNLFHGGKYPYEPVSGQALRNSKLLRSCLTILEKCLSLDANVKDFFEDLYDE